MLSKKLLGSTAGEGFDPSTPIGTAVEGGYFAGFISHTANGVATHALIVAPAAAGETTSAWQSSASTTGATSPYDGAANTALMTSSPAANFCTGLTIDGYSDWYLPARYELDIAYYNLKPTTESNITSAGVNDYSVPKRTVNYTSGDPAQTSVTAFKTGNSEAFDAYFHWSSTEYSSSRAWYQRFNNGLQDDGTKTASFLYVRAFRKVAL